MYTPTEQRHIPKAPSYRRLSAPRKGYGRRWQKARDHFLSSKPPCAICKRKGLSAKEMHVDHIKPHRGDMKLLYDVSNLQALCKSCHSTKTNREDGGFGNITADAKAEQRKKYAESGYVLIGDNTRGGWSNYECKT